MKKNAIRDKARDKVTNITHKIQSQDIMHQTPYNTKQNTYTSLLLAQHMIVYQNLQCKEKKQVDLLHSNENRNPTSKRQGEKCNV